MELYMDTRCANFVVSVPFFVSVFCVELISHPQTSYHLCSHFWSCSYVPLLYLLYFIKKYIYIYIYVYINQLKNLNKIGVKNGTKEQNWLVANLIAFLALTNEPT